MALAGDIRGAGLKRLFDLALAGAGLIASAPLIAIAIAAIRTETPGPGLFRQTRIGRNGQTFTCYKLRTMRTGVGDRPSHEAGTSAITPLGARLRRLKLDEVPQLWNVLRGEMSLVGPRPCLPSQTELIDARTARGVLAVRPGITGLAQVEGIDMSEPTRLAIKDAEYVAGWSFGLDLQLLLRTLTGAGQGDAAR